MPSTGTSSITISKHCSAVESMCTAMAVEITWASVLILSVLTYCFDNKAQLVRRQELSDDQMRRLCVKGPFFVER